MTEERLLKSFSSQPPTMNSDMLWERCFPVQSFTLEASDVAKACKRGMKRQARVGGQFLLLIHVNGLFSFQYHSIGGKVITILAINPWNVGVPIP